MHDEELEAVFQEAWNTYICEPDSMLSSLSFGRWLRERCPEASAEYDERVVGRLVQEFVARWGTDEIA